MPGINYALIADYVRAEHGIAHVISAGIDTIIAPQVPWGQNVGLLVGFTFARNECGRPHRIEVFFQGEDGDRLVQMNATVTPEWADDLPAAWTRGVVMGFNLGVPLPRYGEYSIDIMVNDNLLKSIPFRVVPPPDAAPQ